LQRWLWRGLLTLGVVLAVLANHWAGEFIDRFSSRDTAAALACRAGPADPVYVLGGYPYDLPFLAERQAPLRVLQDWAALQGKVGDEWRSELLDGVRFDADAARVLVELNTLPALATQPGQWLVVAHTALPELATSLQAFERSFQGRNWSLYRSAGTSMKPGCTP
jgi:hypothetical protein